jgi:hypothetical protein
MNAPRAIEGRWSIFGEEKPPHYGTLFYDPDTGLRLEIPIAEQREVSELFAWFNKKPTFPVTIQGRDERDTPISLLGCSPIQSSMSVGLTKYTFRPLLAVLGQSVESWDSALYQKVRFHLTLLDRWLGKNCLQIAMTEEHPLQVRVAPGNAIEVLLPNGTKSRIKYDFSSSDEGEAYSIKGKHSVWLEFAEPIPARRIWIDHVQVWRRFMTLVVGAEIFVESVKFEVPGSDESADLPELLNRNEGISKANRSRFVSDMILPYNEIESDFPAILNRWFEYHNQLDAALDLYFATIFNRNLYINHQFLLLRLASK